MLSFSKTLKLEWLERLSSFSEFESDNEQGQELREICSGILASTESCSQAGQGPGSAQPLGPRQGRPGDCTAWRVEMSQGHFEEVDLKNLRELVFTEVSTEGCGATTFSYQLEFRGATDNLLCLYEEESYGEWDRALPFLSSSIKATAQALAERLAVPLTYQRE